MRKSAFLAAALMLSVALAYARAPGPANDAGAFRPADKLFSVAFPARPSAQEDSLQSGVGAPYKRVTYVVQGRSSMLMAGVVYVGRGKPATKAEQADLLEHTIAAMLWGLPDLVLDEGGVTDIKVKGHDGKQIRGVTRNAGFYARMFVTASNLFMVQVVYDQYDQKDTAAAEAFVESFAITENDAGH